MWVAREFDESLSLWECKPHKHDNGEDEFWYESDCGWMVFLDKHLFPGLSWGDEPIEVDLVKHCKHLNKACIPDMFSDICNECKNEIWNKVRNNV